MTDLEKIFKDKYKSQIEGIAEANKVDTSVGYNMLTSNVENVGTDGKIYSGGGVMDFTDISKEWGDVKDSIRQSEADKARSKTTSKSVPSFQYNSLSQEDANTQAGIFVKPYVKQMRNAVLEKIYTQFKDLPQQLAQRGQALGGQRELAEQNLTTEQAFGLEGAELQGQQMQQDYAQNLMETDATNRSQAIGQYNTEVDRAYNSYMDELNMGLQAEATQYNRTQDELDRMTAAEKVEYQKQRDLIGDAQWQATQNRLSSSGSGSSSPSGFGLSDYQGRIDDIISGINGNDNIDPDEKESLVGTQIVNYLKSLQANGVDENIINNLANFYGIAEAKTFSPTYNYTPNETAGRSR